MALKTQKLPADNGSAEVQVMRDSYNALLDLISSSADFAVFKAAVIANTSEVVKLEVIPNAKYRLPDAT